jgi:hypothetical protein
MPQLDTLLVACMSYGSPGMQTLQMMLDLQAAGATVLLINAPAGLAMARCQTAGTLERVMNSKGSERFEYVFLLDSDVWGPVVAVQQLVETSRHLTVKLGAQPSVGGLYLSRHNKQPTAVAHALRGTTPVPCGTPEAPDAIAVHALCGLGAFLMPISSFIDHCARSERMLRPAPVGSLPLVCSTSPIRTSKLALYIDGLYPHSDELVWLGDDYDFCMRELEYGRHVLLAPTRFRHTSRIELEPTWPVIFPGLHAPNQHSKGM